MMATLNLPMPSTPNETIRVSLEGATYAFRWLWNERDDHWTMSIADIEGTPVVSGLRVVIDWDLLTDVSSEGAPPGKILFFDLSTSDATVGGEDPGLLDMGDRVQGYYIEASS